MLTLRQAEILNFIKGYSGKHGYPPSRLDIAVHFDFAVNAASDHLKAIEKKGYIALAKGVGRGIKVIKKAA